MTMGEKIFEARKKLGISQEELAQQIGVSRQAISKWERNETLPDTSKIITLSSVFSVSTDYLLCDVLEKPDICDNEQKNEATLTKTKKINLGKVLLVVGLFIGIFSVVMAFVWKSLINNPEIAPLEGSEQVVRIMDTVIAATVFSSLILIIAGVILLVLNISKGKKK